MPIAPVGLRLPYTSEAFPSGSIPNVGNELSVTWNEILWAALTIVGVFAIAHGHAHGVELPGTADALAFTIGFVVATGLLHLTGILIGVLARWPHGVIAIRVVGCMVAIAGFYFVYGYASA